MNVLLASTGAEIFSGASKCLVELASELQKRDICVVIILPRNGELEEILKQKQIRYVVIHEYQSWYLHQDKNKYFFIKRLLNIGSVIKMIRFIKKEKIDIVHINALTSYVAGWAAAFCNKPLIWHIREFMEEDLGISFYNPKYSYQKINRANQIIAISEPIKDKWEKILTAPIKVINDGVPIKNYYVEKKKYSSNCINIIIYGRIVPGKGQLFFFRGVYAALKNIRLPIHCYWAGKVENMEYFKEICQYIEKNNMTNIVNYIGEIDNIKNLLSQMDISCICSKCEGFGRVTVESMLGGCIVLGADTGATKEIIQDKETGILYTGDSEQDFIDKLSELVNNFSEYQKIALKGQQYASTRFSIKNNTENILKVYQQLVE